MKQTILLFAILLSSTAFGQKKLLKQVTDSVCTCFEEKMVNTANENLNDSLSSCIGMAMVHNGPAFFKAYDIKPFTVESIRFIHGKIIARLQRKCKVIKDLKK